MAETSGYLPSSPPLRTMPPKRDGGKTNYSSTDSDNSDTFRRWTGRPLDEPMWFYVNKNFLLDEIESARDLITRGIVISEKHGTIFVSNVNHAQAYISSTITEGTLEAPFQLASLPALVAVPAPAARTAPGVPPPPPAPAVLPILLEDLGPASKRLDINPEMIKRKSEAILRHFTDRITNNELRILPLYTGKPAATEKKTTNTDPTHPRTGRDLFDNAAQMGLPIAAQRRQWRRGSGAHVACPAPRSGDSGGGSRGA